MRSANEYDRFTLTNDHVSLAMRMYVSWNPIEFGAPTVDPKRPYGNGDVVADLGRVLNDCRLPPLSEDELVAIHREMGTALQVILRARTFEPGEYKARKYSGAWVRA